MQDTKATARKIRVQTPTAQPPGNTGLTLVDHHCPHCGSVSRAPLTKLAAGPLGMWCCDDCDQGFTVQVVMEPIDGPTAPFQPTPSDFGNATIGNAQLDEERVLAQDQLIALHGEQLLLQCRLAELTNEVEQLKSELA